jgi:hypothetical protein
MDRVFKVNINDRKFIIKANDEDEAAYKAKKYVGMEDADYSSKSSQGWDVEGLYSDGSRKHAILRKPNGSYVIALGYDTNRGDWGQGIYDLDSFKEAERELMRKYRGAKLISDAFAKVKKYRDRRIIDENFFVIAYGQHSGINSMVMEKSLNFVPWTSDADMYNNKNVARFSSQKEAQEFIQKYKNKIKKPSNYISDPEVSWVSTKYLSTGYLNTTIEFTVNGEKRLVGFLFKDSPFISISQVYEKLIPYIMKKFKVNEKELRKSIHMQDPHNNTSFDKFNELKSKGYEIVN